jgi:thiol-disulfide isomerase/thioredoxin
VGRESNKRRRERQATTAREKAAAARLTQRKADQRRRALVVLSSVVVVFLAIGLIAVVAINHKGSNNAAGERAAAQASVVDQVTSVTPATLATVGVGEATDAPKKINDAALTAGGKPEVLFVGGEFCPYCAAERWSIIQALSRFGTFSNLSEISSSSTDVYPNTATFSFYKSKYASKDLSFVSVENENRSEKSLEPLTSAQTALFAKYGDSFPFLYIGGKYVDVSPVFSPAVLKGLTQAQIAAQLNDPTSKVAKAVDGGANVIAADVCSVTNNTPAAVCQTPTIKALQSKISG